MTKPNHTCPLCEGTGKVCKRVADAKITVRNRETYNETMRRVNAKARDRRKLKNLIAT